MRGEAEANCGYSGRTPKPCSDRDMMCGKLFCDGENWVKKHPFVGQGGSWPFPRCYFLADIFDPAGHGMVPTGTKCGHNRVCYNYKCQDVEVYGNKNCSANCNNHGVCNHKGECHCDPGWASPYCSSKEYSTPDNGVIIGVCAAGAVIVLLALLVGGARFWKKGKPGYFCKKKPHSGKMTPSYQREHAGESQLTQPLNISQPVFLETTSKRMDAPSVIPVMPSRPAPLPPQNSSRLSSQGSNAHMRPTPPPKPSPAVSAKLAQQPTPPPVPPVKPSAVNVDMRHTQAALRPPTMLRQ